VKEFEELIRLSTLALGSMVEGISALIIAYAVIQAAIQYLRSSFRQYVSKLEIRLGLAKSLALALEFLLAADILRTAVAPDWNDIGKLAAIAVLRTLLNYFLERELKHSIPDTKH
jgi:uncharacterized membrane protein